MSEAQPFLPPNYEAFAEAEKAGFSYWWL